MRHIAGAEAIVNIDHRYPSCAAIEHGQQRRQTMEVSPIPYTGGHRNDRFIYQAPTTLGSAPSMPATTTMTLAAARRAY